MSQTHVGLDRESTGTPRWVKVFGIISLVLVLLVVIIMFTGVGGEHGPGRHIPSANAGGDTGWGLLILLGVLVVAGVALNRSWLAAIGVALRQDRRSHMIRRWLWWPHLAREWPVMTMTPGLRRFALTAHVTSSVGWLGAVAAFLALAVAALTSQDAQLVRAAYLAMDLTGWYALVPLALASLLTGIVQSLGTEWGLFRHYWVLVKLLLTVFATIILLSYMQTTSFIAGLAEDPTFSSDDFLARRTPSAVLHAGGGLLVLLVTTVLGVYKPRGMTPYGWRKQHEQQR